MFLQYLIGTIVSNMSVSSPPPPPQSLIIVSCIWLMGFKMYIHGSLMATKEQIRHCFVTSYCSAFVLKMCKHWSLKSYKIKQSNKCFLVTFSYPVPTCLIIRDLCMYSHTQINKMNASCSTAIALWILGLYFSVFKSCFKKWTNGFLRAIKYTISSCSSG